MTMFSEELRQLDKNTVRLMIDDLQNELDQARGMLNLTQEALNHTNEKLDQKNEELDQAKKEAEQSARRGELTTLIRLCIKKMQKGTSMEDIADILEEDFSVIQKICNVAEKYAPEYDVEKICRDIEQNNM